MIALASQPGALHSAVDMLGTVGLSFCEGSCRENGYECAWCRRRREIAAMCGAEPGWWRGPNGVLGHTTLVFSVGDKGRIRLQSLPSFIKINHTEACRTTNAQRFFVLTPGRPDLTGTLSLEAAARLAGVDVDGATLPAARPPPTAEGLEELTTEALHELAERYGVATREQRGRARKAEAIRADVAANAGFQAADARAAAAAAAGHKTRGFAALGAGVVVAFARYLAKLLLPTTRHAGFDWNNAELEELDGNAGTVGGPRWPGMNWRERTAGAVVYDRAFNLENGHAEDQLFVLRGLPTFWDNQRPEWGSFQALLNGRLEKTAASHPDECQAILVEILAEMVRWRKPCEKVLRDLVEDGTGLHWPKDVKDAADVDYGSLKRAWDDGSEAEDGGGVGGGRRSTAAGNAEFGERALERLRAEVLKGLGLELPPGWRVTVRTRQSGTSTGHRDAYYLSPGGRTFRSRNEVRQHLKRVEEIVVNE